MPRVQGAERLAGAIGLHHDLGREAAAGGRCGRRRRISRSGAEEPGDSCACCRGKAKSPETPQHPPTGNGLLKTIGPNISLLQVPHDALPFSAVAGLSPRCADPIHLAGGNATPSRSPPYESLGTGANAGDFFEGVGDVAPGWRLLAPCQGAGMPELVVGGKHDGIGCSLFPSARST